MTAKLFLHQVDYVVVRHVVVLWSFLVVQDITIVQKSDGFDVGERKLAGYSRKYFVQLSLLFHQHGRLFPVRVLDIELNPFHVLINKS